MSFSYLSLSVLYIFQTRCLPDKILSLVPKYTPLPSLERNQGMCEGDLKGPFKLSCT